MARRFIPAMIAVAACAALAVAGLLVGPPGGESAGAKAKGSGAFGLTKVRSLHLTLSAKEYRAMQPTGGPQFPGPGARKAPPKAKDKREREKNLFGVEFPWAEGELTVGGQSFKKVALRYDGNGAYFASASDLKRPLRIDLARNDKQHFHGLRLLNLHNAAMDPSRLREALACAAFRAAGVPAPRTAFAEVTLTVPGQFTKAYLGLYTLVEEVDEAFVRGRFKTDRGLLMRPQRLRGLDYLGNDWEKYTDQYRPLSRPTKEQARRVVAFARLVNQASDKEFQKEIGSYLDVDAFLRFTAANALLANAESFFALGSNYSLYLHPKTNKFIFLPGDLELSFAGFLMMGRADQLMDMSLTQPYSGPNRLPDRLFAIKEVKEKYLKLVKELAAGPLGNDRLLKEVGGVEKATKALIAKDTKAAAERRKRTPGFGFGPPGGVFAAAPSLRAFAEKRAASVANQLAGKSRGYNPRFRFGPPMGGGPSAAVVNEKTVHDQVKAPREFEVTLFGAPPTLSYPVAISATPAGEVFIAIDEQGSLGRTAGGGRALRCIDKGDGKAVNVKTFAKMEHPRGLIAQNGTVWVMHPPDLTVYHDDNGDGVADRQETLVTGLTTDMITKRGGDHTTNGIRMGIDGWIYIGVGDYGILKAKGKDGKTITLRGGGIARVRPDGTDLEIYATGLRNPFDMAIDPYLNIFTRDNTNDGAGWDTRVSHIVQTAKYGYTQLYANFPDEIMPPLGAFGGGGATGGLFVQDPHWPAKYNGTLYTGDWGRSEVYRHELAKKGASFELKQEVFLKVPRATGMDIDASGRLYVASWMGGEASV